MTPDHINASFELSGSLLTWMNVWWVYKDKGYAGLYFPAIFLFTSWGFWNLWYYPHLGQWWSGVATIIMVSANTCWCGMMLYYGRIARDSHT